jgi:hypothetical protein
MKLALALLFFTGIAYSQTAVPEPAELVTRRNEYLRAAQQAQIPVLTSYLRVLEGLSSQFTRDRKVEAALAVQTEMKDIKQRLETATNVITNPAKAVQLVIVSATYGSKTKVVDITKSIRKFLEAGQASVTLNTRDGAEGKDPAPFTAKETTIVYQIDGKRQKKTFPEGTVLNFASDLK